MALKLRTRGFKRLIKPAPILTQKFTNDQIVLEFSKNNWSGNYNRVGYVRALVRDGLKWVQLGQSVPVFYGKQTARLDIAPATEYQIQIVLARYVDWINVKLWEILPD